MKKKPSILFTLCLTLSVLINVSLLFYLFGNWQVLPEWDAEVFGYRFSIGKQTQVTKIAVSRVDELTGHYDQLVVVSKDIRDQFKLLQVDFIRNKDTAELTRQSIAETRRLISDLEVKFQKQSTTIQQKDLALQAAEQQLMEEQAALQEALKTVKNQQRQLKASPIQRMDNEAYILQYEFNKLSKFIQQEHDDVQFIQTSLRQGIVSVPASVLFIDGGDQLTDNATSFLISFVRSLDNLPQATVQVIQFYSISTTLSDEGLQLSSELAAIIAKNLLSRGMDASRMSVASQPASQSADDSFDVNRLELRINI